MKQYFLFSLLLLQISLGFAQAPNKMSYQAVIRNSNNVVVSNHVVGMRISILQGTATGTAVYTETQSPTTNANGLIAIEIGTGTFVSGSFTAINWSNGPYFVKTESDPNGSTNYTLIGTSQLLSVPYALYAQKTDTAAVSKFALNGIPSGSQHGQTLTNCDGNITWTYNGQCPAKISAFNCADTLHVGVLNVNQIASTPNCSTTCMYSTITYSGGNGGVYAAQSIASSGVLGLTAEIGTGNLNNGNGSIQFQINGTPTSAGIAAFTFSIGNKSCTFYRTVNAAPIWPAGTVFCNGTPTAVVDVTNPITGKTWMDRNLGASRAATSSTDADAYGDLYQWGRAADGHQCRNSGTTSTLSSTDQPGHGNFIIAPNSPNDWRSSPNNNLWQGVNGTNNPCPIGYRIPTSNELETERLSWSQNNNIGAFGSPLKITLSGYRSFNNGVQYSLGSHGDYWSNNATNSTISYLYFTNSEGFIWNNGGAWAFSVRCIKN
jgi:uncharacterized protein (TIGR02145 family)